MDGQEKCCGTCRWHIHVDPDDWECKNPYSEYCADYTMYDDFCDEWECR